MPVEESDVLKLNNLFLFITKSRQFAGFFSLHQSFGKHL